MKRSTFGAISLGLGERLGVTFSGELDEDVLIGIKFDGKQIQDSKVGGKRFLLR